MPEYFRIRIHFLQPAFHGRGNNSEPEWPPSPLRVFQAIVAAAAARWEERQRVNYAEPALQWLGKCRPPDIVAPAASPSENPYLLYIPNNTADLLVPAWKSGDVKKAVKREQKPVRTTHLAGEALHYLYPLPTDRREFESHLPILHAAARSITHLGWGVDMVAAEASLIDEAEVAQLPGERWQPVEGKASTKLRVPIHGTLADLTRKHSDFLNRISPEGFRPVPPLSAFDMKGYRRINEPAKRLSWAAFRIVSADPDSDRSPSFDTALRARDVACWLRHAAGRVYAEADVATFIHGHDPDDDQKPIKGEPADERLLFLPLPTINSKLNRVEAIRRVLVAGPVHSAERLQQLARALEGEELIWQDESKGMLTLLTDSEHVRRHRTAESPSKCSTPLKKAVSDYVLNQYIAESCEWSTVTPVIWPGHDDGNRDKAEQLLRRSFLHAGLPEEVVKTADIEWRNVGFRAGLDLASRYTRPDKLSGRAAHVRVCFKHPVRGPLAVGAGRYRGFGLFVAE